MSSGRIHTDYRGEKYCYKTVNHYMYSHEVTHFQLQQLPSAIIFVNDK